MGRIALFFVGLFTAERWSSEGGSDRVRRRRSNFIQREPLYV